VLLIIGVALALVGSVVGFIWWLADRNLVSTDDAFIDAHVVHIAPQTSGRILRVLVTDNQLVQAGDPLIEIDAADAQARLRQSESQRAQELAAQAAMRASMVADKAQVDLAVASLASARSRAGNARRSLERYLHLGSLDAAAVAAEQIDQLRYARDDAESQVAVAVSRVEAARAQLAAAKAQYDMAGAQIRAASAALEQSSISLGYTRIDAPIAGHITRLNAARGNQAQIGDDLMLIVPLQLWVTANFKETELEYLRPGQRVDIAVDAYPGLARHGTVDSIQRGSGQVFSLLPPENATGNYVKVVQRVPVKIRIDDADDAEHPLGPGMSVRPSVHIR
jgi:membrane fusion protein (multidrug efflux system)